MKTDQSNARVGLKPIILRLSGILTIILLSFTGVYLYANSLNVDGNPQNTKSAPTPPAKLHPVIVRTPDHPPMVNSGKLDHNGNPLMVSCATCHETRKPDLTNNSQEQLDQFHQGLTFKHGQLSCLSCHNAKDYNQLRLADGTNLRFQQVMQLCGQCHGPQYRDYQHGAHGGMNGYWDLKRGPRKRNNCIDCHDPHAPDYPIVTPVFPQSIRFKNKSHTVLKGIDSHE